MVLLEAYPDVLRMLGIVVYSVEWCGGGGACSHSKTSGNGENF
jgi:hypothetical protein